jgi:nitrogen fixation/metabolism regulation signal transduction histidine kinase
LSAERLERRLLPKLEDVDRPMLEKSVRVIVEQVDAMKRLVNEFRDFARLPNAELTPLDANELIRTVISLYDEQHLGRIVLDLQESLPLVLGDAQQLRQVIHNLVQNGLDAHSDSQVSDADAVRIATRWTEGTDKVRLLVQDSGPGFPDHILRRAFEPYVTTKKKGTGLGLAVVKKIADDHHARIELSNRMQGGIVMGAQVSLSLNTASADGGLGKAKGTT